jgi:hypothetical protein
MANKDSILRGQILEFLRELFPQGTDQQTIISIFYEYHTSREIVDALEYLVVKGYVEKRAVPHFFHKHETILTYTINGVGIDLHDGLTNDPGVTVVKR